MGVNLMDPGRRAEVFETSKETSRATLLRQLHTAAVVR
jgi:hypothetical protein